MEKIVIEFKNGFCKITGAEEVSKSHLDVACIHLEAIRVNRKSERPSKKKGIGFKIKKFFKIMQKLFKQEHQQTVSRFTVNRPVLIEARGYGNGVE